MTDFAFELQEKQSLAFVSPATEILYGGAAGGGKSYLMRVAMIAWCEAIPGLQCYLFRRTYPMLVNNHLRGPFNFYQMLSSRIKSGYVKIVKNEIRWGNGSRIALAHAHDETSVYDYQGAEMHVLGIDELTHFTETMYKYLLSRVRITNVKIPAEYEGMFPRVLNGANPGGIGHAWVKNRWVAKKEPMKIYQMSEEEGSFKRQYIPAKVQDNQKLLASDPLYVSRLMAIGDKALVRAMLDGDWNIATGSMFGESWREELHTVEDFCIPSHWSIWRGADDGFSAPHAAYWISRDPKTKVYYVINELYKAGLLPDKVASLTAEKDYNIPLWGGAGRFFNNVATVKGHLDSAAFSEVGVANDSGKGKAMPRGVQINAGLKERSAGIYTPVEKWPGSVVHRTQFMHKLLAECKTAPRKDGGFWPGIRFFKSCTNAIETIPVLMRDKNNVESIDSNGDDHAFDAVTYGLQFVEGKQGVAKTQT